MNDKKTNKNDNLSEKDRAKMEIYLDRWNKLKNVKREDLCTLREAIHYAFFGILPGSKYDADKADACISELVNSGKTGLHLSDSVLSPQNPFPFNRDTIDYEGLRQRKNAQLKGNCPFFILQQPQFLFFEQDCCGEFQNTNYNPILRYFNAYTRPEGFSYRFESLVKRTQNIFVSLTDLKRAKFLKQFHKFWEENKNEKLPSIKIDNLISLIPSCLRDKALSFLQKIDKSFLLAARDMAVIDVNDKDQECILKQLHNNRIIYVNSWYEEAKRYYISMDLNYACLKNYLSIMQGELSEKDLEARLELSGKSENRRNLDLVYKGNRVLLKTLSRNCIAYHLLERLLQRPDEFFSDEEINKYLKGCGIRSFEAKMKNLKTENIEPVENLSKEVNNIFRLKDSVKEELKELHPELEVKNLLKRFFTIKGNSICYTPFYPEIIKISQQ